MERWRQCLDYLITPLVHLSCGLVRLCSLFVAIVNPSLALALVDGVDCVETLLSGSSGSSFSGNSHLGQVGVEA